MIIDTNPARKNYDLNQKVPIELSTTGLKGYGKITPVMRI